MKFSQKSQILEVKDNCTCIHIDWCQQWHHTEPDKNKSASEPPQPPNKRNVDDNNLSPHWDLYCHPGEIIDHLPGSVKGKAMCSLNRWDVIDIYKYVMYCPKYNVIFCVLCCHLFHSGVYIMKMEDSISEKILKTKLENHQFLYLCVYKFLWNVYTIVLVNMGSINP